MRRLRRKLLEAELDPSGLDDVARLEELDGHLPAVDEGAVGAAEVLQKEAVGMVLDERVAARDGRVVERQVRSLASDGELELLERRDLARLEHDEARPATR